MNDKDSVLCQIIKDRDKFIIRSTHTHTRSLSLPPFVIPSVQKRNTVNLSSLFPFCFFDSFFTFKQKIKRFIISRLCHTLPMTTEGKKKLSTQVEFQREL
ncbi:hypothetical protein LI328DRAFT_82917 [Trichoderma asperelloides]|nr:hypothetical protein LI328DRAFT_82917 [Trichoderma asperelloides]